MAVEIYTKTDCMFCKKAKALFDEHGVTYEEIDCGSLKSFKEMQERVPGATTVPQILIDGHLIGGFDVLDAHKEAIFKKLKAS